MSVRQAWVGLAAAVPALAWVAGCAAPVPQESPEPADQEDGAEPAIDPVDEVEDVDEEALFRTDVVHRVSLELPGTSRQALLARPRSYATARLTVDDGPEQIVGVRLKGRSTFQPLDGKPSLKVRVDHVVPGQSLFGHDGFMLHNQLMDASLVGEVVAWTVLAAVQVPAMRVGFATVAIDGEHKGVYALVERKDAAWLEDWYGDDTGGLYESNGCDVGRGGGDLDPACWEVDREGSNDTWHDLDAWVTAVSRADLSWADWQASGLDVPGTRRMLAAEWVLGHWDGYSGARHNHHLYHRPSDDSWHLSAWSLDLAFGRQPGGGCGRIGNRRADYRAGHLAARCQDDPGCEAALLEAADELVAELEAPHTLALFDALSDLLAPELTSPAPLDPTPERWARQLGCARTYAAGRRAELGL